MVTQAEMRRMMYRIDAEALVALCTEAEIVTEEMLGQEINGSDLKSFIVQTSRRVLKAYYDKKPDIQIRTFENEAGFSVTVKSDEIQRLIDFNRRYLNAHNYDESFDEIDDNPFAGYRDELLSPQSDLIRYFHGEFVTKENRIVFYLKAGGYSGDRMVFQQVFELIRIVEDWLIKAEQLDAWQEAYVRHLDGAAERRRIEEERRERELAEERERARVQLEAEMERQRLERIAQEERERIAREERERAEQEERARQQAEHEERQRLIRAGATDEGIDIAARLMAMLGR